MKKAVLLLSGGLDSTTCLAIARARGFEVYALSFAYGQQHTVELDAACEIAASRTRQHRVLHLDPLMFQGSALTTSGIDIPKADSVADISASIPVTYVPARNTIFLSFALGWAEVLGAHDIFIGVNAVDFSGYPDCRPAFIEAFERMANLATKAGVDGETLTIHTPLIEMTKSEIIQEGIRLGVDYSLTRSCYDPTPQGLACGRCDACLLRLKGFAESGHSDPAPYLREAS